MGETLFNITRNWIILVQLFSKHIHKMKFYPSGNNFTQALLEISCLSIFLKASERSVCGGSWSKDKRRTPTSHFCELKPPVFSLLHILVLLEDPPPPKLYHCKNVHDRMILWACLCFLDLGFKIREDCMHWCHKVEGRGLLSEVYSFPHRGRSVSLLHCLFSWCPLQITT